LLGGPAGELDARGDAEFRHDVAQVKGSVWVLRKTRLATWRLVSPWATGPAMVCSVSVRLSQPEAG
jgi:hypothetical protein